MTTEGAMFTVEFIRANLLAGAKISKNPEVPEEDFLTEKADGSISGGLLIDFNSGKKEDGI